jgi:hypothetical protein
MNGCYFNAISQNSQLPVTFITFDNKTYVQKENLFLEFKVITLFIQYITILESIMKTQNLTNLIFYKN